MDLFALDDSELKKILPLIESSDLIEYVSSLDFGKKEIFMSRLEQELGEMYVRMVREGVDYLAKCHGVKKWDETRDFK